MTSPSGESLAFGRFPPFDVWSVRWRYPIDSATARSCCNPETPNPVRDMAVFSRAAEAIYSEVFEVVQGKSWGIEGPKGDPRARLVSLFVLLGMLTLCAGWRILRGVRPIEEDDELSAWFAPERATVLLHGLFADRAQRCHWVRGTPEVANGSTAKNSAPTTRRHVGYCSVRAIRLCQVNLSTKAL
jgi:hypothetical protein